MFVGLMRERGSDVDLGKMRQLNVHAENLYLIPYLNKIIILMWYKVLLALHLVFNETKDI